MNEWTEGMNGWADWMKGCLNGWMDRHEWIDWMDEWMSWTVEWMEWMVELMVWMDEWTV